jgi:hypothetical protein
MSKYKITNIDEAKGLVTFQVLNKTGAVLLTDTRSDLPIEDKDAVDVILTDFSKLVAQDAKQSRKADAKLLAIVNLAQTVDEA